MKKHFFTAILLFILTINCVGNIAYAAAKQNTQPYLQTINLSENILQEGGLLPNKSPEKYRLHQASGSSTNLLDNNKLKNAADTLMAAWDSFQTECDLTKYRLTTEQYKELCPYLLNHFPNYFYLSLGPYYSNNDYVTKALFFYKYTTTTIKKMLSKYEAAITAAVAEIDPSWSEIEKALYLNDYLTTNCQYDTTYSKYTAYDALVGGTAVCQGYSEAYQALLAAVGIPSSIVSSDSLNHAWNMVFINGQYYYVDVTWNDPLGMYEGFAGHTYFLKSANYFRSKKGKHLIADDWVIADGQKFSDAKNTFYDNYFWNTINTAFEYIDGSWYTFDGEKTIKKYAYRNGNFENIENIITIDDIWYVTGGSGAFWREKYVGISKYNDKLYYSLPDKIFCLDVKTKKSDAVYELPTEQKKNGNIWSISIGPDGQVYYYWSSDMKAAEKKPALQLEKAETSRNFSNCYHIRFNGNHADSGRMKNMFPCFTGQTYFLAKNTFTRDGYTFTGWNTKPNGTGVSYPNNAKVQNLMQKHYSTIVLYAQWKKQTGNTRLSNTNLKVKNGKAIRLKLLNNTQKVNWKITSGKKYISLKKRSSTGVTIKGLKKGNAKVQAIIRQKKYTCSIKVI